MYIVSQNRRSVVNVDKFDVVTISEGNIFAYTEGGRRYYLGGYSEARAKEVFSEMIEHLFPTDRKYSRDYYYMPEE